MSQQTAGAPGPPQHARWDREFGYSQSDFASIRDLIVKHAGISLSEAKLDMVYSRLAKRLRRLGLRSFSEYCKLITEEDSRELVVFINALTTNLTAFFREPRQFRHLETEILPKLAAEKPEHRLRVWSAGCSTGEEPYSIAMVARETLPPHWDVKILATDIDTQVLATAAAGTYPAERVADLPQERLRRWFRRGTGSNEGLVRIRADLRRLTTFRSRNLIDDWSFRSSFDLIFCRNVAIYFDTDTRRRILRRFAEILTPGGHLFVGHSESLLSLTDRFELLGAAIYRALP